MYFSPEKLRQSIPYITGLNLSLAAGQRSVSSRHYILGNAKNTPRPARKHTQRKHFGELLWSDSLAMCRSSPFNFIGCIVFLDDATRFVALYYLRKCDSAEVNACFQQFLADYKHAICNVIMRRNPMRFKNELIFNRE